MRITGKIQKILQHKTKLETFVGVRCKHLQKGIAMKGSEIIGQTVRVEIDRPLGSVHPKYPNLYYPINYGFVPGVLGGDGAEQDIYLLGVCEPVKTYLCRVIGVIHRLDDVEDKWVCAPEGMTFSREEILEQTAFQEQFFHSELICEADEMP